MTENDRYSDSPSVDLFTEELRRLKLHDRVCFIYENSWEWQLFISTFIRIGLERGEKCYYVFDTHTARQIRNTLKAGGVDVASAETSGKLVILHGNKVYMVDGVFDIDRMTARMIEGAGEAIAEGYTGLRITGETEWVLQQLPASEKLLECEAKLDRDFFPQYPCLAVYQYARPNIDSELIKNVVLTSRQLIVGSRLFMNYHYIPPEIFLDKKNVKFETQYWLDNLERENKREQELTDSNQRLQVLFENAENIIMIADDTGHYLDANKAALDFLECSREQLLKKTIWNDAPPGSLYKQHAENTPLSGPVTIEAQYLVNQKQKTLMLNIIPIESGGRKVLYGIGRDISDRQPKIP
jgi:PAS domain S-box-containing protein